MRLHTVDQNSQQLTLIASGLGFMVVILDVSVVNVAAKALNADLGGGITALEWVINGYTVVFAAFLLTVGALNDRLSPTRLFQYGFTIFAIASLVCGFAGSLPVLIGARLVQGLGAALIVPSALALINLTFVDPVERTRAISLWSAAGGLALVMGPVVGGVLTDLLGWRSIFLINIPIAVVGSLLISSTPTQQIRDQPKRSIDALGQIFAILTLVAFTSALIEANSIGWTSVTVLSCAVVSFGALIVFLVIEFRSKNPMLPLRLFRERNFRSSSLIGILVNFAFYGFVFVISLFFQSNWGFSASHAGLALLPTTVAIMAANLACGPLLKRYSPRIVIIIGGILGTVGFLLMLPVTAYGSYLYLMLQLLIVGLGAGLVAPAVTNVMLNAVDLSDSGIASGVLSALRQIGGLIGVAVMGLQIGQHNMTININGPLVLAGIATAGCVLLSVLSINRQDTLMQESPQLSGSASPDTTAV